MVYQSLPCSKSGSFSMAAQLLFNGTLCTKVVNADATDVLDENGNLVYVDSGMLTFVIQ